MVENFYRSGTCYAFFCVHSCLYFVIKTCGPDYNVGDIAVLPSELDGKGSHLSTCSIPVESRILIQSLDLHDLTAH